MKNPKPLISVIIPIYRVEKYLLEGVRSVQHQTYTNLEIILVDDGSPDECPKMCDDLVKQDSRIKVVHKVNGGLSDARNAGMLVATGKFTFFMDSDDEISLNCIELHYNAVMENKADFSVANVNIIGCRSAVVRKLNLNLNANRPLETYLNKEWNASAWNKLYRTAFLKDCDAVFEKGLLHEDVLWSLKISERAKKIAVVKEPTYFYKIRKDSITTEKVKSDRINSLLFIIKSCNADWNNAVVPESLKDSFVRFVDYWRFYTALALLRFEGGYIERSEYYGELKKNKLNGCSFNKYGLIMSTPYLFFSLMMTPILKIYKIIQRLR